MRDAKRRELAELSRLAGDTSMCALARSGRSFPAAKYHEGAAVALAALDRGLHAADREPAAVLDELITEWRGRADAMRGRGREWEAYVTGAVDALEALHDPATTRPRTDQLRTHH